MIKTKEHSLLLFTRRQFFLDLRLTPEVLAHYLAMSSIEKTIGTFGTDSISITPKFPLDAILITITNRKFSKGFRTRKNASCVYQRINAMQKLEAAAANGCFFKGGQHYSIAQAIFLETYDFILQCDLQRL